jgi:MFS family permease
VSSDSGGARLGLLRNARDFRLLFFATLASSVGTWLAFVALVIDVFDRTGDARWVSGLLIVDFLPIVVIGLFAGPLLDRLPRRSILIAADLVRALVFFVLPFTTSALQIVLLALAAGVATSLFRPAAYAGLPNLVGDHQLPRANGLVQSAENVAFAAGPAAGGAIVATAGTHPAYWFNGVTFLVSALLIAGIRKSLEQEPGEREGHWREVVAGLRLVTHVRALLAVLVAWSVAMLALAATSVAEIVLAKVTFDAGDFGYGFLFAATGLGLVLGSLATGAVVERRGARVVYPIAIALMGIGFAGAATAPNVWIASAILVLSGTGNGAAVVCNALLVQRGAPDQFRGRAFTVLMSTSYAVLGIGTVAAGPLTNSFGPRDMFSIAAGLAALSSIVALVILAGPDEQEEEDADDEAAPELVAAEESPFRQAL